MQPQKANEETPMTADTAAPSVREALETKIALAINEELCRQIDAKESTDTLNVTSKIVALPCIQSLIDTRATPPAPTPSDDVRERIKQGACACANEIIEVTESARRQAERIGSTFVLNRQRVTSMIAGRFLAIWPDEVAIRAKDAEISTLRMALDDATTGITAATVEAVTRAVSFEEAAGIAENHSFGRDIDWWLNATKKDVSAESCLSVAAAIRAAGEK
jgi:hypothetical protein